jgi:hypothetical protein
MTDPIERVAAELSGNGELVTPTAWPRQSVHRHRLRDRDAADGAGTPAYAGGAVQVSRRLDLDTERPVSLS